MNSLFRFYLDRFLLTDFLLFVFLSLTYSVFNIFFVVPLWCSGIGILVLFILLPNKKINRLKNSSKFRSAIVLVIFYLIIFSILYHYKNFNSFLFFSIQTVLVIRLFVFSIIPFLLWVSHPSE